MILRHRTEIGVTNQISIKITLSASKMRNLTRAFYALQPVLEVGYLLLHSVPPPLKMVWIDIKFTVTDLLLLAIHRLYFGRIGLL